MSIKTTLLAVATAAVLAAPAAALAHDYGHYPNDGYAASRGDARRFHDQRDARADGYGYGYRGSYSPRAYGGGYVYAPQPRYAERYSNGWRGRGHDGRYERRAYDQGGYRAW
jgi:hypothetical protein